MEKMKVKIGLDAYATYGRVVIRKVEATLASRRGPRQNGPRQKGPRQKDQGAAFIAKSASIGHLIRILCESSLVEPCM